MGYFLISNEPVFVNRARYEQLFAEAGKAKSAEWRIGARIEINGACRADDAVFDQLCRNREVAPELFYMRWVRFDFWNTEAQEIMEDLLTDYCTYYQHCSVRHTQDDPDAGEAAQQVYVLTYRLADTRALYRRIWHSKPEQTVTVVIHENEIRRVTGTLRGFSILTSRQAVVCSESVCVSATSDQEIDDLPCLYDLELFPHPEDLPKRAPLSKIAKVVLSTLAIIAAVGLLSILSALTGNSVYWFLEVAIKTVGVLFVLLLIIITIKANRS